jgi:hypothetical protein
MTLFFMTSTDIFFLRLYTMVLTHDRVERGFFRFNFVLLDKFKNVIK